MIDRISQHPELQAFIAQSCMERGYSANIADDIPADRFLVIKVDQYYHKQGLHKIPPAIDCLIVIKCTDGSFMIYLVELKNIKRSGGFSVQNIYSKFKCTIKDFMGERFHEIFLNQDFKIRDIQAYFVSDPYRIRGKEISRSLRGTKIETLLNYPAFKFGNKICKVKYNAENLIIRSC